MTNTISHPLTKTMSISEAEKEISKYPDGTPIQITYLENTQEASESEFKWLSDYRRLKMTIPDVIKAGKSTKLTKLIEDLIIPKSTRVTFTPIAFTPTEIYLEIKIKDPIILILTHFKKMCSRVKKEMLGQIQSATHPNTEEGAIRSAVSRMYHDWERGGGYREAIAKVKRVKTNDIKCSLIGDVLKKLREAADKTRRAPTIEDIEGFVRKAQKLTPEDIIITDTKPTSTRKQPHSL